MLVKWINISERGIRLDAETAPATVRWTKIEITTVHDFYVWEGSMFGRSQVRILAK